MFLRSALIVFLALIIICIPFWFWNLDILVESLFYQPDQGGWHLQNHAFWDTIYKLGIYPGLTLAIFGLFLFAASFWNVKLTKWRKPALFLFLSLILGPGLVINVILKDNYGRPRPYDIQEFGGTKPFVHVLVPSSHKGKSFPCGHGSIGFYLSLPFLFLRRKYNSIAIGFLVGGTVFGSLMSYARMLAGGHFLSDVIWGAGLVWIVGLLIAQLLNINQPVKETVNSTQAKRVSFAAGILLPILTMGVIVATPYISKKEVALSGYVNDVENPITLSFKAAEVNVVKGDVFELDYQVQGFGFPNSRVLQEWEPTTQTYQLKSTGFFTELGIKVNVYLPEDYQVQIELAKGTLIKEANIDNLHSILGEDVIVIE